MYQTPKRIRFASNDDSGIELTPDVQVLKTKNLNVENNKSPQVAKNSQNFGEKSPASEARRGRPRANVLSALILEGSTSPSSIKCKYCGRVFPREKSLQAHLRTHTGEKPYVCDYPRCTRRFAQSGQLKTHQRLHTGEKPFVCTMINCTRRFTHANRHCPDHPDVPLKKHSTESLLDKKFDDDDDHNAEVREWLLNWDKRNNKGENNINVTPKKSIFKREDSIYSNGSFSNCSQTSSTDEFKTSPKSELDDSDISMYNSSDNMEYDITQQESTRIYRSEIPKKRWLREAVQNASLWESTNDLACPINWNEDNPEEEGVASSPSNENQNRPSVLVCVQGGKSKEISNDEIQGAMALVELKNGLTTEYKYRV